MLGSPETNVIVTPVAFTQPVTGEPTPLTKLTAAHCDMLAIDVKYVLKDVPARECRQGSRPQLE